MFNFSPSNDILQKYLSMVQGHNGPMTSQGPGQGQMPTQMPMPQAPNGNTGINGRPGGMPIDVGAGVSSTMPMPHPSPMPQMPSNPMTMQRPMSMTFPQTQMPHQAMNNPMPNMGNGIMSRYANSQSSGQQMGPNSPRRRAY